MADETARGTRYNGVMVNPTAMTALGEILEPLGRTLTVEAARAIADFAIAPELVERLEDYADRCNEGQLSEDERREYQGLVEGAEVLALLKLIARRALDERGAA